MANVLVMPVQAPFFVGSIRNGRLQLYSKFTECTVKKLLSYWSIHCILSQ